MEKDIVNENNIDLELSKGKSPKLIKNAPNQEDKENLHKWYFDYIDHFRKEFEKLNDDEKKCIPDTKNFLKPCQIEVFWIKEPSYQLIVQSNYSQREDKEIFIHGPYDTHIFMEKILTVLKEGRFQNKIKHDSNRVSYPLPETDAEQLAYHIYRFIQNLKDQLFHSQSSEGYSGVVPMNRNNGVWLQYFRGNIAQLDSKKEVQSSITEIKQIYEHRMRSQTITSVIPDSSIVYTNNYSGFGVHFFPPLSIGEKPKLTLNQYLNGNNYDFSLSNKILDTQFDNKIIILNKNGYLFIETLQKFDALKIFNLIMALGYFHDLPLFAVKEHELSAASYHRKSKNINAISWNMNSIRTYLFNEGFEKNLIEIYKKRNVKKEKLEEILDDAKIIINNEKLSEELRLFNVSNTHLENSEYAQSFITSWSVIERYYSDLWRIKLDQKDIDDERLGKLTNSAQWGIDFILEVLNLNNEIDDNTYDLLMELKRKRNRFYHRGKQVAKEDAERCLSLAKRILESKILEIKSSKALVDKTDIT